MYPNAVYRIDAIGFTCSQPTFRLANGNNNPYSIKVKSHSNTNTNRQATSINKLINNNTMLIYPNPTKDVLNIECLLNQSNTLIMTDILGNTVKQIPFNTKHLTLNLNDMEAGVYFITLTSGTSVNTQKVVVSK